MSKIISFITTYFWIIFLGAVILGLTFPTQLSSLYLRLTPLIIVVMFLGSLDIEYHKLNSIWQYKKLIIGYIIVMMIVLPVVLYYGLSLFSINTATGVFLLAAAPAGIASIAFVRLMGGNALLALSLTVISTCLVPLTIPFLSQYIINSTVIIDAKSMFMDLVLFCILPIIVAYLTQRFMPRLIDKIRLHIDRVSILLIGLMIAGPVAYNADLFLSIDIIELLISIGGLFIVSIILHTAGRICFGRNRANNIAGSLSKGFMNISLITVIAAKYFSPEVLLIVLLYEFPRDLMLIPFKRFIKKYK